MTHSSRRKAGDPFESQSVAEVSLSLESEEILDQLNNYSRIKVTIPADRFEVRFEHDQYLTIVEGRAADSYSANLSVALCQEEIGFYPRSLIKKTGLKRVVLCEEIYRSQKPNPRATNRNASPIEWDVQPLHFEHELAGGLPDVVNGILYLPINCVEDDPSNFRKVIHHEFYHCIQWRQFGAASDPEWEMTNPPDFVYGPGGIAACFDSDSDFHSMPMEEWGNGFLNFYCMSAPEEDQAEIFSHLITEPARIDARLTVDDILRRKTERLKTTLNEFCRDMNDQFWQLVSDSRLPFDL